MRVLYLFFFFFKSQQQPFYKAQSFIWFVLLEHETGSWFRPAIHPLCPSQGPRMELIARPGPVGHRSQKVSDGMENIFVCSATFYWAATWSNALLCTVPPHNI